MGFKMGDHDDGTDAIKKGLKKYEQVTKVKKIEVSGEPKKELGNYIKDVVVETKQFSKSVESGIDAKGKKGVVAIEAVIPHKVKSLNSMKFRKRK